MSQWCYNNCLLHHCKTYTRICSQSQGSLYWENSTMSCKMSIFRLYFIHNVTDMLTFLEWPILQERRCVNRPSKIAYHHLPVIELPSYFIPPTRQLHKNHFTIPASSTVIYLKKLFSKYFIMEWSFNHRRSVNRESFSFTEVTMTV